MADMTIVINSKVEYLRKKKDRLGRTYNDLKEWCEECSDGVYIGRSGPVFVIRNGEKKRYPPGPDSIWANPFKATDDKVDEMLCKQYGPYIVKKIKDENLYGDLMELDGKQLACWCLPDHSCHGEVLHFLILYYKQFGHLDEINFNVL